MVVPLLLCYGRWHDYLCLRCAIHLADSELHANLSIELCGDQPFLVTNCAQPESDAIHLVSKGLSDIGGPEVRPLALS